MINKNLLLLQRTFAPLFLKVDKVDYFIYFSDNLLLTD